MASLEDNGSEDGEMFSTLFVDEDYVLESFDFGDSLPAPTQTTVLCSQAASTDYDLTGQVVWPVSVFLAWYVAKRPEIFAGQVVVELGAGCGLPGIVAARTGAASCVLTDGSSVVMRLLNQQKETFDAAAYPGAGPLEVLQLEWGTREGVAALHHLKNPADPVKPTCPTVLLGADVVCWPSCVVPLLETVKGFFLNLDDPFEGVMFLGYVCRATDTRDLFFREAIAMGFAFEKIPAEEFLPLSSDSVTSTSPVESSPSMNFAAGQDSSLRQNWPENVRSCYDLELYRLALDPRNIATAMKAPSLNFDGAGASAPY